MNGFQRRKEMKMNSILSAAFELFLSQGIKKSNIAEIAKKAGVSQVSIYNFFQNKQNLVRQTVFAYMDDGLKKSERVLESDLPFPEKLEKLLFISDEADRQSGPEFFKSVIASDPSILGLLNEYYQSKTEPFILRLVEQGKQEGCINPDLSAEALRLYIRALQELLAQPNLSKEVILDINALFFYGLQGKPPNH
ncbi:MAG: TetR/AcrR family transcriptional regulator [Anaerolineaceae bacterium]|nr:TetR/AcrR family transcriptional regulator [Anaerolineaceae bacterium]